MKLGIPLGWPDDPAAIGPAVTSLAVRCDTAGLDSLWTADHLFQIPVTGLPRESPMLEGYATIAFLAGPDAPHPPRRDGDVGRVPPSRHAPQGGHDPRRVVGGPHRLRRRRRVGHRGGDRARHPVPAHRRALRTPRGGAADRPSDVGWRRLAVRRGAPPPGPTAELAPGPATAAPADPRGGQRRAQDAAARRRVRRRLQPVRPPSAVRRGHPSQAGRAPRPLRGRRTGPGGHRGHGHDRLPARGTLGPAGPDRRARRARRRPRHRDGAIVPVG